MPNLALLLRLLHAATPPLTVACAGLPFQRFIRVKQAEEGQAVPRMYAVRQPEWRTISLTGMHMLKVEV